MSIEEILQAYETKEILEYHVEGVEQGVNLLPGSGWYPCQIDMIYESGNVEIALTGEEEGLYVTVLKKNIPIAFRRKHQS